MKKVTYHLVIREFIRDLKDPDKLDKSTDIFKGEYDTTEEATEVAKKVIQRRLLEETDSDVVYTKWGVDNIDDVTTDKLIGNGITYYQEVRDDHTNNFYEGYACIIERKTTIKDYLLVIRDFLVAILFFPVWFVYGFCMAAKLDKEDPAEFVRYQGELRTTPIKDWGKLFDKYFNKGGK